MAFLEQYKIILGSASPRRRELLASLDVEFSVEPVKGVDETAPADMPAMEIPEFLSRKKASAYPLSDNQMLITADTLVISDNKPLGKPVDAEDARHILRSISGKTHQVVTGVCISTTAKTVSFSAVTDVTFSALTDDEIDYYIKNYKPFDKAGAYGIQEWIGAIAVSNINGSYYNVMGLPLHRLYVELKKFL